MRALPNSWQDYVTKLVIKESVQLKITRPRKTKLGDYKFDPQTARHFISVNNNLKPTDFLITFLHELAHKNCYDIHKGKVAPHGAEWKALFQKQLYKAILALDLSGKDEAELLEIINNTKATRSLKSDSTGPTVSDLKTNDTFIINNRKFQLLQKRRTRYLCKDLSNEKLYTVSGEASVKI